MTEKDGVFGLRDIYIAEFITKFDEVFWALVDIVSDFRKNSEVLSPEVMSELIKTSKEIAFKRMSDRKEHAK